MTETFRRIRKSNREMERWNALVRAERSLSLAYERGVITLDLERGKVIGAKYELRRPHGNHSAQ
jgi:hypothetical protein